MRVTVSTQIGDFHTLDVSMTLSLADFLALVAGELGNNTSPEQLTLSKDGRPFAKTQQQETLQAVGIRNDDLLLVTVAQGNPTATGGTGGFGTATAAAAAAAGPASERYEQLRREIMGNNELMQQLRRMNPQLVDAAVNNPQLFAETMARIERHRQAEQEQMRLDMSDPFDVEAQRRIEEAIRAQQVAENFEAAVEHNPESFGRVIMLYIDVEINKVPVKAFVDSGAQATIMSPDLADKCGLSRLIDKRFAGVAHGVGTAKILGRVHAAEMKMSPSLYLMCSFTVMEGKGVDLLFGLDMLKRHQAIIDLEKNVLRIQGAEIRFLSEHELPDKARDFENTPEEVTAAGSSSQAEASSSSNAPLQPPSAPAAATPPSSSLSSSSSSTAPAQPPSATAVNEDHVQQLMALGVGRAEALQALKLADGNVDLAAGMLF
ncbi:DNA damage-inducible protein 1 [Sorochytrium milnesiophthora]